MLKTAFIDNIEHIFDPFRRKYVVLTPEEWVRQQLLHFLVEVKKYPTGSISVEKMLMVNGLRKRYDAVVYCKNLPWMLIECKAETEAITEKTLQQIMAYKSKLEVTYMLMTNGKQTAIMYVPDGTYSNQIPAFPALND